MLRSGWEEYGHLQAYSLYLDCMLHISKNSQFSAVAFIQFFIKQRNHQIWVLFVLGKEAQGPSSSEKSTTVYMWVPVIHMGSCFHSSVLWVSAFQTLFQQAPSGDNLAEGTVRGRGEMGSGKNWAHPTYPLLQSESFHISLFCNIRLSGKRSLE